MKHKNQYSRSRYKHRCYKCKSGVTINLGRYTVYRQQKNEEVNVFLCIQHLREIFKQLLDSLPLEQSNRLLERIQICQKVTKK